MRWLPLLLLLFAPAFAQNRAWIGITLDPEGCRIQGVVSGTPGERAGLKAGDEIFSVDGDKVANAAELIERVGKKGIGAKISLRLRRAGNEQAVSLVLEARPDELQILRQNLLEKPLPELSVAHASSRVDNLKGKVVIIEFWATWCEACAAASPRLRAWQEKYGARGLRIVGVSTEPWETIEGHFRGKLPPYTLVADDQDKTTARFRVPAIPTFVVVGRDGKVRFVDVGAGERLDAVEAAFLPLLR
jgi:thiol-disulfide isomerase/thioredoxin